MKKVMILLITIVLCFGVVACGEPQSQENQGTTVQATTAAALENPFGFDPNHAASWAGLITQDDWQKWADWMKSKGLQISKKDNSLGDFKIKMSLDDARQYFPSKALSEKPYDYGNGITKMSTLTFKDLTLAFVKENNTPFMLFNIEATGAQYVTSRGLKVGDSVARIYALYGVPIRVDRDGWAYSPASGAGNFVTIKVKNKTVQSIKVGFATKD